MSTRFTAIVFTILVASSNLATAQFVQPSPEHKLLKRDVGTWEATTTMWMGEDGKPDPTAEPAVSKGKEVNHMLGDFWIVSNFEGEFGGMSFTGHSTTGYDLQKKQFVGSWIDSVSPSPMHMIGTFDKATDTMTFSTKGVGMDGQESLGKIVVKYTDDARIMTMYDIVDGKEIKSMQVVYKKVKD